MRNDKVEIYSDINVGLKRSNNEDQAGVLNLSDYQVLLIADGMGGHLKGEVASDIVKTIVLDLLANEDKPRSIREAKRNIKHIIKKANSQIYRLSSSKDEYYGMGTTLVLAMVLDEETIIVNCGDSRAYAYLKSDNSLRQITVDQTCVEYLYELGAISKEEMLTHPKRHVLMNALGIGPSVSCDFTIVDNSSYDILFLCSDGYSNMVNENQTIELLKKNERADAKTLTDILIAKAIENGGVDNISISLLEVKRNENK